MGGGDPTSRVGPLAAFAALGVFWGAWAALLPLIKRDTDLSDGQLGVALLGVGAGALPAMLLMGPLADRLGRRAVGCSALAFALAAPLPGLAVDQVSLTAALAAVGAASGALDVAMNAAISELEATGARLMNAAHALFSATMVAASVAVGAARQVGAGRLPVLLAVALLLALCAALNRNGARPRRPSRPGFARASPELLALGLLCALAFAVEGATESWSALHLERTLGAEPVVSSLGPGLFAVAMVAGRVGAQLLASLPERLLLVGGACVGAAGAALAAVAWSVPVALLGFVLVGVGMSVAAPTLFGRAGGGAGPGARARAISVVTALGYLGFLVSPPLVGGVAELAGLRAGIVALAALALTLGVGGMLALRPVH